MEPAPDGSLKTEAGLGRPFEILLCEYLCVTAVCVCCKTLLCMHMLPQVGAVADLSLSRVWTTWDNRSLPASPPAWICMDLCAADCLLERAAVPDSLSLLCLHLCSSGAVGSPDHPLLSGCAWQLCSGVCRAWDACLLLLQAVRTGAGLLVRAGGGWCRFGAGQLFSHAVGEEGAQGSCCPCSGVAHLVLILASASSSATHPCCCLSIVPHWGCEGRSSFLAQVGISFPLGALCFPVGLELCLALAEIQAPLAIPQLPRGRDLCACASCWLESSASGCWASLSCQGVSCLGSAIGAWSCSGVPLLSRSQR